MISRREKRFPQLVTSSVVNSYRLSSTRHFFTFVGCPPPSLVSMAEDLSRALVVWRPRFHQMNDSSGFLFWLDLHNRFIYTLVQVPFGPPTYVCHTGVLCPEVLPAGQIFCHGQPESPVGHCHSRGLPEPKLREEVMRYAVRNACALWGERLSAERYNLLVDYYGYLLRTAVHPHVDIIPQECIDAAVRGAPYPLNLDGSTVEDGLMDYYVDEFFTLIELNARFIINRHQPLMDTFRSEVDLGYPISPGAELPRRDLPYERTLPVPRKSSRSYSSLAQPI